MGPCRLLLPLLPVLFVYGAPGCKKQQAFYQWNVKSDAGPRVSLNMTTLDKNLADHPEEFRKCFEIEYKGATPAPSQYSWTNEVWGRKKRDLSRSFYRYTLANGYVEIPFLIAANWSLCKQHRLALAIRKFEAKTCIKFVPFKGVNEHNGLGVLMIHNSQVNRANCGVGTFGQSSGIYDSTINGQVLPLVTFVQMLGACEYSVEHELMHTLGFIHAQDSPYRQGPQSYWDKEGYGVIPSNREKNNVEEVAPWEIISATSYVAGDKTLTDWDTYKINQVYKCERTTYGDRPIDMSHKPAPVVNVFN